MEDRVEGLVDMLHSVTDKSVAVGFGVSKPEHCKQIVSWGAEGVICGSALVRCAPRVCVLCFVGVCLGAASPSGVCCVLEAVELCSVRRLGSRTHPPSTPASPCPQLAPACRALGESGSPEQGLAAMEQLATSLRAAATK